MSSYSTAEYAAINWYCEQHDLIPQLSVYPKVRMKKRSSDEIIEQSCHTLLSSYIMHKKEEAKEKQRLKRQEKKS